MLFDTHAHLDMSRFEGDRKQVIARAHRGGLGGILNVGIDLASSRRSLALAKDSDRIWAAVGIHPHDAESCDEEILEALYGMTAHEKVLAVGETGLDFYRDRSPRDRQIHSFRKHIRLAKRASLPLIVHCREADEEVLGLLREEAPYPEGGIMHCFAGDETLARACINLGFFIAAGGVITYNSAGRLRGVFREVVPLERIVLETDAPYLAPQPRRGHRNEPSYVRWVAETMAGLKGLGVENVAEVTTRNALQVLGLDAAQIKPGGAFM